MSYMDVDGWNTGRYDDRNTEARWLPADAILEISHAFFPKAPSIVERRPLPGRCHRLEGTQLYRAGNRRTEPHLDIGYRSTWHLIGRFFLKKAPSTDNRDHPPGSFIPREFVAVAIVAKLDLP